MVCSLTSQTAFFRSYTNWGANYFLCEFRNRTNFATDLLLMEAYATSYGADTRRKRTQFTAHQKEQLLTAYNSGLNCTSSVNQQRISAVAKSIGLDETVVKVL